LPKIHPFFTHHFPGGKLEQVSGEFSTLASPKIRVPNHLIKLLHFAFNHHFVTGAT
jgi:hypothetical protein